MKSVSRRQFLGQGAAGIAAAGSIASTALSLRASPLGIPIGFQIYPVRESAGKDFPGTLRQMAGMGFQAVELCSFPGYAQSGFGPLAGMKPAEIRQILKDAGLGCVSSHFTFRELKSNLDDSIAWAKGVGLKYVICSSFGLPRDAKLDDWRSAAADLNVMGEKTRKAGLQIGFHNHNNEFVQLEGSLIYDEIMKVLDPKLVKMQLQLAIVGAGHDPLQVLQKYSGRFCSLHLADWSSAEKKMVPVGKGVLEWNKIFAAAKKGGVRTYFIEMNLDLMRESVPYMRVMKA